MSWVTSAPAVAVFFGGLVLAEHGDVDFAATVFEQLAVDVGAAGFAGGFDDLHAGIIRDRSDGVLDHGFEAVE